MQFDLVAISSKFRESGYDISTHADEEMQEDDIQIDYLEEAIGRDGPKIIEKYQYSCLILGWSSPNEPIHAVVALGTVDMKYDTPIVVTAYRPNRDINNRWKDNYAKRKKKCF